MRVQEPLHDLTPEQHREKIPGDPCPKCGGPTYSCRAHINMINCEQCQEAWSIDRDEVIDEKVREVLEKLAQDALYWELPKGVSLLQCGEPMWDELRDSIIRNVFDMEREQIEHEIQAQHVVDECL